MSSQSSTTYLENRLDLLLSKIDDMLTANNSILAELKRNSDVVSLQIEHIRERIQIQDKEFDKQASVNTLIYTRLDKLEKNCIERHGSNKLAIAGDNNNITANNLWEAMLSCFQLKTGTMIFWAVSLAATVWITKVVGRL